MFFEFTEDQKAIRKLAYDFAEKRLSAVSKEDEEMGPKLGSPMVRLQSKPSCPTRASRMMKIPNIIDNQSTDQQEKTHEIKKATPHRDCS